jgi:hypothetical protein
MTVTVVHPTKDVPEEIRPAQVSTRTAGMNVHGYTSVYISRNKVEPRLGTYA